MSSPTLNCDGSTLAGSRGGDDMSRAKLRAPRTKFAPPVSIAAFSAAGLVSAKFVGASASKTFSAANRTRRSSWRSEPASSISPSSVRPAAR